MIWSDLDAVWLRDFQKLAPRGLEVVLVDDSEAEEERHSDNTGTGMQPPHPHVLPGIKHLLHLGTSPLQHKVLLVNDFEAQEQRCLERHCHRQLWLVLALLHP